MVNEVLSRARQLAHVMRKEPPCGLAGIDAHPATDVAAMLRELGIALVEVEQPTQVVAARLMAVAQRYTAEDVRVVVFPGVLFIQVGAVGYEVDVTTRATVQLDVAGVVDDIAELAAAGAIAPTDAVASLRAARSLRPRFGPVVMVMGYAITTVGFGMLTDPTWRLLAAYALLGAVVGIVELLGRPFPQLAPVLPTAAATVVTILATIVAPAGGDSGLLRFVGPALVAILPGIALTLGAMELAGSSVVAGASRLVYGVVQLLLIAFGVSLGLHIVAPGRPHPDERPRRQLVSGRGDPRHRRRAVHPPVCTARLAGVAHCCGRLGSRRPEGGRRVPLECTCRGGRSVSGRPVRRDGDPSQNLTTGTRNDARRVLGARPQRGELRVPGRRRRPRT